MKMITFLTILSILITVVSSREIYFSKSKQSRDVINCGDAKTPCRTLGHAVRIARTKDAIIFQCNQERNSCKFRLRRQIDIFNKDLTIKSFGLNPQIPIFYFETGEVFQLRGGRVKLTFSNITIHLRRSIGNVLNGESRVVFKQCSILIKKRRYSLGIPSSLKFVRVNRYAVMKLYLIDSRVVHLKFDKLRILNLLLTEETALSVDIYIFNSIIDGNILATLKSAGAAGRLHISETKFNYTTLDLEGTDQSTKTWSSIKLIDSEIQNGRLNQQLSLKNLKDVQIQNITFKGWEIINSLRAHKVSSLIISGLKIETRMALISNIEHLVIEKAHFNASNLIIQQCKTVMLTKSNLNNTVVSLQNIHFLQSHDDVYTNSELKVSHSNMVIISSGTYTTNKNQLLTFSQSTGVIRNVAIYHRPLRVLNSKLTILNSIFLNNSATEGQAGGALYNQNSTLVLNDTIFQNCSAKYFGGCYYSTEKGSSVQMNRVSFISFVNDIDNPFLLGSSIYATTRIDLNNVNFVLHNTTRSPVIFIEEKKETLGCDQKISSLGDFKLECPVDQSVDQVIRFNERNDLCDTNNFDFLAISCVPCNPGYINPLKATSENQNRNIRLTNNKCTSCANETFVQNYFNKTEYEVNCPLVVVPVQIIPVAASPPYKCLNNHTMVYDPQCPDGFHFSIFSNECLHHQLFNSNYAFLFWSCLIVIGCLYSIILMYIKEIVVKMRLKQVFLQLKVVFEYCCCYCRCCSTIEDDFQLEERPDIVDEEFDLVILQADQVQIMPLRFTMGTTLGIVKILFFFYQVESVIRVSCPFKEEIEMMVLSVIRDTISSLMSLRLQYFVKGLHLIPARSFNEVGKEITRATFGLWLFIPIILILIGALVQFLHKKCQPKEKYQISEGSMSRERDSDESDEEIEENGKTQSSRETLKSIPQTIQEDEILHIPPPKLKVQPMKRRFDRIDGKVPIFVEQPLGFRVKCFLLMLLTLMYLPISTLILRSIDCVEDVDGESLQSLQQDIRCYQGIQFLSMVLIALWVVPFPLAVYFASVLQYTCKLNPREFFISLLCPPSLIFFYIRGKLSKYRRTINRRDAMMAKHLLMTLYEPFRLQKVDRRFDVMWDVAFLARKLVVMVLIVFSPNGIGLYLVLAFLVLFILIQVKTKPFNRDLTNRLELLSLVTLCFLTIANIFWEKQTTCLDHTMMEVFRTFFVYAEYLIICAPLLIGIISIPLAYLLAFVCMFKDRRNKAGGQEKESLRSTPSDEKDWHYPDEKDNENKVDKKSRKTSTVSATGLVFNEDGHWVGTQENGSEKSREDLVVSPRREARLDNDSNEALLGDQGDSNDDEKRLVLDEMGHSTV